MRRSRTSHEEASLNINCFHDLKLAYTPSHTRPLATPQDSIILRPYINPAGKGRLPYSAALMIVRTHPFHSSPLLCLPRQRSDLFKSFVARFFRSTISPTPHACVCSLLGASGFQHAKQLLNRAEDKNDDACSASMISQPARRQQHPPPPPLPPSEPHMRAHVIRPPPELCVLLLHALELRHQQSNTRGEKRRR